MDEWFERMREKCVLNSVPVSSRETQQILKDCLERQKPLRCLEIWTALGVWTYWIWSHIRSRGWSLQTFEISYPSYHTARRFVQSVHLTNTTCYFANILQCNLANFQTDWDFVFIDGMKSLYQDFFETVRPWCSESCVFVFDDVWAYSSRVTWLKEHCESLGYNVTELTTEPWDSLFIVRR